MASKQRPMPPTYVNNIISQLDLQADNEVPLCSNSQPPSVYFQQAAGYLREAGQAKKSNLYEQAYIALRKYIILITDRLAFHKDVSVEPYREEYYFNKEKIKMLEAEIEKVKQEILKQHQSFQNNLGAPTALPPAPTKASTLPPPPSSTTNTSSSKGTSSFFSGWFGSGNKTQSNPPPPPTSSSNQRNLPPPPPSNTLDVYHSNAPVHDKVVHKAMEKALMNEEVQDRVGKGVAQLAMNEQVQERVANGVQNMAHNKEYQRSIGAAIASSSDNAMIRSVANNEHVQAAVGSAIANTIGNKEVQKKVGAAIAKAATDKETQKKVASGLLAVGKFAWGAAKTTAQVGGKAIVATAKTGYGIYQEVEKQKKDQQND